MKRDSEPLKLSNDRLRSKIEKILHVLCDLAIGDVAK